MDDSKISELKHVHRELAQYLVEQSETILILRRVVGVIQQTLENDSAPQGGHSALSKAYREYLQAQTSSGSPRPNPLGAAALESLVKKLTEW
jgi:hypothetical protein